MVVIGDNDAYWKYCNVHVHQLTLIIAVLTIVLNIMASIGNFATGTYFLYAGGAISTICSILLIAGNRRNVPLLYWPYLILQLLLCIGYVAASVFLFIMAASYFSEDYYGRSEEDRKRGRTMAIVLGVVYILVSLTQVVFLVIVNRDFRFVRDVCCSHPVVVQQTPPPPHVVYQTPMTPPQVVIVDSCHDAHFHSGHHSHGHYSPHGHHHSHRH